jgi:hypothetical protein
MGGVAITATFKRTRGERTPRWIRDEIWQKIVSNIGMNIAGAPAATKKAYKTLFYDDAYMSMGYVSTQRRKWKATEGELHFVFTDVSGLCHLSSALWAHWTERYLAMFAATRKKDFAEDLGIVLTSKQPVRALLAEGALIYPYKGKLYAAQGTGDHVHLMGNGTDVTHDMLPAAERIKARKAIKAKTCRCPVCSALRRDLRLK